MHPTRPATPRRVRRLLALSACAAATTAGVVAMPAGAWADTSLTPGDLLVSTSVFTTAAPVTAGVTKLPPGCGSSTDPCATAEAGGSYPTTFNNAGIDGSYGVTEPIVLDTVNPTTNAVVGSLTVPDHTGAGDQLVTSFSSKSELALNPSTDGASVTFMGYNAPVGAVDVSNSNTPGEVDPTNPVTGAYYRDVARLDSSGAFQFTETNAYSGNNGRAAVLDTATNSVFTVGNAGNGGNPPYQGVVQGAGSQILPQASTSQAAQESAGVPAPTAYGNFNITELGDAADKSTKDNNFRGLTVSNDVVYATKGSGSNGVNTVYFVDTTGKGCPSGGVGLPQAGATLPSASTWTAPAYSTSNPALGLTATNPGLAPTNMCILSGFPTTLAKAATTASSQFPFGVWFANPTTLYVADEGNGDNTFSTTTNTYTNAAAEQAAGLEKWTFNGTKWVEDYVLQGGLNLGQPYSVGNDSHGNAYPTGTNTYTNSKGTAITGPWTPAVDGLRNLTGRVNADGTVTLWAATSTVSGSGDQGTDPNALVSITDNLAATAAPAGETFSTVLPATYGQVIRGVSFTPNASPTGALPESPWLPLLPLSVGALGTAYLWHRSRRTRATPTAV